MTALDKYARLEAAALWRADASAQRLDVIVSLGEATLTIKDMNDRALTHWSLAAVARANPGKRPAIFHPDGDAEETLELAADEDEMIRAIEKLRKAVERARPHKGRLRGALTFLSAAAIGAAAYVFVPGMLVEHALRVVPEVKRTEIGDTLMQAMEPVTGPACEGPNARLSLRRLTVRLQEISPQGPALSVMRNGVQTAVHLPGERILLGRALVEDHETPDVVAGFILAEIARREAKDPLRHMLETIGPIAIVRFLTTGSLPETAVTEYARALLTTTPEPVADDALLNRFEAAEIPSSPYAYALDVSGETSLALIEGDPFANAPSRPVLSDGDWLRLQSICEG